MKLFFLCLSVVFTSAQNLSLSCPPTRESIERMMEDAHIPGMAIVVVNRTHTLYKQGFGYTTPQVVSKQQPIDPDQSIFLLASISKTFIAVAAMQLVERGLLDLDANINDYLPKHLSVCHPEYPEDSITMKHLLSHTSSIGPNPLKELTHYTPGDEFTKTKIGDVVQDYVSDRSSWLSVRPGTNVTYSNVGTTLAALVIERIAKMPFEEYVFRRILRPLGLKRDEASYRLSDFRRKQHQIVKHYIFNASLLAEARNTLPQITMRRAEGDADWFSMEPYSMKIYPAGLLRTSANSLSVYLRSFLNKFPQILSKPSSTDEMVKGITGIQDGRQYGLIWYWAKAMQKTFIGHRGSLFATSTAMVANEQRNLGVVLFTSGDQNVPGIIASKVSKTIYGLIEHYLNCFESVNED